MTWWLLEKYLASLGNILENRVAIQNWSPNSLECMWCRIIVGNQIGYGKHPTRWTTTWSILSDGIEDGQTRARPAAADQLVGGGSLVTIGLLVNQASELGQTWRVQKGTSQPQPMSVMTGDPRSIGVVICSRGDTRFELQCSLLRFRDILFLFDFSFFY